MSDDKKIVSDSQVNYLINLIKNKYIEDIDIQDNKIIITKKGTDTEYTINNVSNEVPGLMTPKYKSKLDGIEDGATKVVVDSTLSTTSTNPVQNNVINTALENKVPISRTINSKQLNDDIVLTATDVDADSKGTANSIMSDHNTDTTSHSDIRESISSLESNIDNHKIDKTSHITSDERTKWNSASTHANSEHAPSNAEPNQNAFSNIKVNGSDVSSTMSTDTVNLVGNNITLTSDTLNKSITIGITDGNISGALGYIPGREYTHPTTTGYKHIPSGGSKDQILTWESNGTAKWDSELLNQKADSIRYKTSTVVAVDDSAPVPIYDLRIYGKSKQFTTTGKNILNPTGTTNTVNGVTFTKNTDGSFLVNGTATENTVFTIGSFTASKNVSYTVSGCPTGGSNQTYRIDLRKSQTTLVSPNANDYGSGASFSTSTDNMSIIVCINIQSGVTISKRTFYPMVRLTSNTDSAYEPYTGGIPSPNLRYPQEIVTTASDNNVKVIVTGKNLFNISSSSSTNANIEINDSTIRVYSKSSSGQYHSTKSNSIQLKKGIKYTLSADFLEIVSGSSARVSLRDSSSNSIKYSLTATETGHYSVTFSPNEDIDCYVSAFCTYSTTGVTGDVTYDKIQLEVGSTDTSYEYYAISSSFDITLVDRLSAIPVSANGNYVDENGQMWLSNEVDLKQGKYIHRVNITNSSILNTWSASSLENKHGLNTYICTVLSDAQYGIGALWSNRRFNPSVTNLTEHEFSINKTSKGVIVIYIASSLTSAEDVGTMITAEESTIIYPLVQEWKYDLDSNTINKFIKSHAVYPHTTIYTDESATVKVGYYTPNTAVQMIHSLKDKGKILHIDQHGCVVSGTLTDYLKENMLILSPLQYGYSLPEPGNVGRLFFSQKSSS